MKNHQPVFFFLIFLVAVFFIINDAKAQTNSTKTNLKSPVKNYGALSRIKIKQIESYYNNKSRKVRVYESKDLQSASEDIEQTYFPIGINGKVIITASYKTIDGKNVAPFLNDYYIMLNEYNQLAVGVKNDIENLLNENNNDDAKAIDLKIEKLNEQIVKLNVMNYELQKKHNTIDNIKTTYQNTLSARATFNYYGFQRQTIDLHLPGFDDKIPVMSSGMLREIYFVDAVEPAAKANNDSSKTKVKDTGKVYDLYELLPQDLIKNISAVTLNYNSKSKKLEKEIKENKDSLASLENKMDRMKEDVIGIRKDKLEKSEEYKQITDSVKKYSNILSMLGLNKIENHDSISKIRELVVYYKIKKTEVKAKVTGDETISRAIMGIKSTYADSKNLKEKNEKALARLQLEFKVSNIIAKLKMQVPHHEYNADEINTKIIPFLKDSTVEIVVDLPVNGPLVRSSGDNVVVRIMLCSSSNSCGDSTTRMQIKTDKAILLTLRPLGLSGTFTSGEMLSNPSGYIWNSVWNRDLKIGSTTVLKQSNQYYPTDVTKGALGFSASYVLGWGTSRRMFREFDRPIGLGLTAAIIAKDGTPETSVGASLHLFDSMVQTGWGYNMNSRYPYFFIGSNFYKILTKIASEKK